MDKDLMNRQKVLKKIEKKYSIKILNRYHILKNKKILNAYEIQEFAKKIGFVFSLKKVCEYMPSTIVISGESYRKEEWPCNIISMEEHYTQMLVDAICSLYERT